VAHKLRRVRLPVVWVGVEPAADAPATAEVLWGTGMMYRHIALKPEENFTTADAEAHEQRNAALAHVEKTASPASSTLPTLLASTTRASSTRSSRSSEYSPVAFQLWLRPHHPISCLLDLFHFSSNCKLKCLNFQAS